MIRHIVLFKLKNEGGGASEQVRQEIKKRLEALPGKIGVIRSMEVGINIIRSDRAYDLALVSTFDGVEDLEVYRVHPAHQEVVDFIARYRDMSAAVDFHI